MQSCVNVHAYQFSVLFSIIIILSRCSSSSSSLFSTLSKSQIIYVENFAERWPFIHFFLYFFVGKSMCFSFCLALVLLSVLNLVYTAAIKIEKSSRFSMMMHYVISSSSSIHPSHFFYLYGMHLSCVYMDLSVIIIHSTRQ